jgi:hypothetical protein
LQQFNSGVKRTSIGLKDNSNRLNIGVEWVCAKGSTLNGSWGSGGTGHGGFTVANFSSDNTSDQGEFHVGSVADSNSVRSTGGLDNTVERTLGTILNIDTHLVRGVVRTLPQFKVSIQRTSFGLHNNLDTFNGGGRERPGLEGSTLDQDRVGLVPDSLRLGVTVSRSGDLLGDRVLRSLVIQENEKYKHQVNSWSNMIDLA